MLDQLAKNITRCGLSNSTLNYLRVCEVGLLSELISPTLTCPSTPLRNAPPCLFIFCTAMCDTGTHAGADV